MEDDWIFLGDGGASGVGSDSDSATDDGSDSDSGFTILRRGRKGGGGDQCSVVVSDSDDDTPAPPWVAAVAVPQPTPPGLAFKVVSYAEAFSASDSSSSEDGEQPGCNDEVTAGESIVQGGGIDDAAGTGSTDDDCTVTCKGGEVEDNDSESCEEDDDDDDDTENSREDEGDTDSSSEDEDEDTFSSSDEEDEDSDEEEDTSSSSDEEDEDSDEEEDTSSSSDEEDEDSDEEEDTSGSSDEEDEDSDEEEDTSSSSDEEDAEYTGEVDVDDVESTCEEDEESTGEEEGDDDPEISGEEEEGSNAECSGEEDDVDSSGDESNDLESYGEEEDDEEDHAESTYEEEEKGEEEDTVSSGDEEESSHVVDVAENAKKDIFAMLFPRATTACETNTEQGAANTNVPSKCDDMDTDRSGSDMDTDSSGSDSDMDTDGSDMEDDDCLESDEEEDIVDVAENADQAIFDMLLPRATACGANIVDYVDESEHGYIDYEAAEEDEDDGIDTQSSDTKDECLESDVEAGIIDVAEDGNQDIFAMLLPKAKAFGANIVDDEDESEHGSVDYEEDDDGSLFDIVIDMLLPRDHAIDDDSADMEDDDCLESGVEAGIVDVAENANQAIFDMLFPKAKACGANVVDDEDENEHGCIDSEEDEDGSLFDIVIDMLLPRDHAIDDDIDTDSSDMEDNCLESDEEYDTVNVAESGNLQDIFDMLLPRTTACGAKIDDYEDQSKHGSIDYDEEEVVVEEDGSLFDMLFPRDHAIDDDIDSSDGEDEAATAAAACGYSAEPSHGTRRPEFAGRAARGYDDIDTDSDMEEGNDGVVAADVNGTNLLYYGWPRATTGGGVESQRCGFGSQSQTERQALWEDLRRVLEDLRRQLAAEAFESSGQQQQSYDDVDDTCDVPGTAAAPGGGPAGSCARTPEVQFTARAVPDTEGALATVQRWRREAAQRELDRVLAREAAAAAQALESALQGSPTAKRHATSVTQLAVAKPDCTFIIGVYVLVFLVVSLLSLVLPSN